MQKDCLISSNYLKKYLYFFCRLWYYPFWQIKLERYRSGHNGADSKSVCEQSHMGSNPILSANGTLENPVFSRVFSIFKIFLHGVFYNFYCIFWRVLRLKILLENRTKSPSKPHKIRLFSRRCILGR